MITPQEFFGFLSDETRLRCLLLLQREKELCVCELSYVIGIIQPKISRHLALLRQSGLVSDERRGQWVYYCLNESLELWGQKFIVNALEYLKHLEPYLSDFKKLQKLRKTNPCTK